MTNHTWEWAHCMITVRQEKGWGDLWRIVIVYKDMTHAKQIERIAESHCAHDGSPTAGYAWASVRTTWDVAERMVAEIEALIKTTPEPTPVGQLSFI